MKKKTTAPERLPDDSASDDFGTLIEEIRSLIQSARRTAATAVNTLHVLANFEIGRRIVEQEQKGARRADYGRTLLKTLSARLTGEFGDGFSTTNLKLMRQFYIEQSIRIGQTPSDQSSDRPIGQTASDQMIPAITRERLARDSAKFALSWSHYVLLLAVKNPEERSFYEIEATSQNWSLRELKRQVASSLYERLALSRDKDGVRKLAEEGHVVAHPDDLFKEPFVLEFLGLKEHPRYSESEFEQAIIDHLERFLLELGKGFLFEARQKRFTFDEDHYFLDLVFYNRLLRCYVIVDLKLGKLTHQDLGQMQMYVNYFDRHVKTPGENPTIGLLLCRQKKDTIVELTLPADANIHAREYQLYLPSKELLKEKLIEWAEDEERRR